MRERPDYYYYYYYYCYCYCYCCCCCCYCYCYCYCCYYYYLTSFLFTWSGDKNNTVPLATQHACPTNPHPTMVELDWPDDSVTLLPSIVLLHRCVGECLGMHKIQSCTVMEQEEVMLNVIVTTNSSHSIKTITVYNHTKCGCACRTRKSDCDTKIHDYFNGTCECKCKQALSKSCNTSLQWFNDKTCTCECNGAPKHCDGRNNNEEWNPDTCDCDCKKKIKNRCNRKGKVLNESKCECECPKPLQACPTGTSFLKYNCTCVDTSVSNKWSDGQCESSKVKKLNIYFRWREVGAILR